MSRLTITLDDALHQALKETATRQGRSIGKIIEEGLLLRGIKSFEGARELVARARKHAKMSEVEALALGVTETRSERS
jgi:predicted transcriptional regulator